jgi:hypothetical protein
MVFCEMSHQAQNHGQSSAESAIGPARSSSAFHTANMVKPVRAHQRYLRTKEAAGNYRRPGVTPGPALAVSLAGTIVWSTAISRAEGAETQDVPNGTTERSNRVVF